MSWMKNGEIPAPILVRMVQDDDITGDVHIVWKGKASADNVIFLATKETLIDMIDDTVEPSDVFEIWAQEEEQET